MNTALAKQTELCMQTLEVMLKARITDEKMQKVIRQNKGGNFHLAALGHELIGALSALSLTPGKDWGLPYYRDRTFAIGLGAEIEDLFATLMGRVTEHHSGGRQMPEHYSHRRLRMPCQSSVVGSQFLQGAGLARSIQISGKDEVVYVSCGDGATSQGDFHEALNYSCLHKLPVLFVVQDNGWAISVPTKDQTTGGNIADVARGYKGLNIYDFDGTDFEQTSKALTDAVKKARAGEGPSLIVAHIPRIGPHSSSDDQKKYKSEDHLVSDIEKDPLPRLEQWILDMGIATEAEIATLKERIHNEVEEAAKKADEKPHPTVCSAANNVFATTPAILETTDETGETLVMVDAINNALKEEMQRDRSIVVFGQDVAKGKGGVFGATRELTDLFGENRCFNTPLAESTITGSALGMTFTGDHTPVVEIQFCDYMWTGINQIINEIASINYRSNGEWNAPLVIRMPYGGYIQGGPYHSQAVEAYLCHTPGLKVVCPSNADDAKTLLKAAIRDPNPVIFLEHKALYRMRAFSARKEPGPSAITPLGKAKLVKEGSDLTIITYGMLVPMANDILTKLEREGLSADLIDLRTLTPLDMETILTSVEKTGKALVAHEAALFGGLGAEIASQISEAAFEHLDAPVQRLGAKNCPIPYSKVLEDAVLPQRTDLERAIVSLAQY